MIVLFPEYVTYYLLVNLATTPIALAMTVDTRFYNCAIGKNANNKIAVVTNANCQELTNKTTVKESPVKNF